jgi:hypothetical protein
MNESSAPSRAFARSCVAAAAVLLVLVVAGCAGGAASSAAPSASTASPAASSSSAQPSSIDSAFAAAHAVGGANPILAGVAPHDRDAIGQASYWEAAATDAGFRLTYTVGWGDCMAGCINSHTFVYDVSQKGVVKLVRETGDAIPADVTATLGQAGAKTVQQGLVGRVVAGPTCPVEKPGDPSCAPRSVPGAVLILRGADGSQVAQLKADDAGLFGIELPPGDYVLQPQPVEGLMGTAPEAKFRVVEGQAIPLEIAYDTGIR